jgi:hypothetical protein
MTNSELRLKVIIESVQKTSQSMNLATNVLKDKFGANKHFVGRLECKIPFGSARRRLGDIQTVIKEIKWEVSYLIRLAQDKYKCRPFVNTVKEFRVT